MTESAAERRVTAADIARDVGVSRATVGFVLNSTPGQTISEATQKKVLAAAERLGYRPHLAAQALASGRNRIILLVMPDWPVDYSMRRAIDEVSTVLDEAGYSLVTMTPHVGGTARPLWETLQPDVVLGMMPFDRQRYDEIRAAGVSAVIPDPDSATAGADLPYSRGPRLQVEHLAGRGHRRLVYAASPDPRIADLVASRAATAAAAARSLGIEEMPVAVVDDENVRALVDGWRSQGITGVVAYNDDIAALVVGAALRLGMPVPDRLAVIGHDDSPLSRVFVPSLSTVRQDDEGLARQMALLALSAATRTDPPEPVPGGEPTLIVREST